MAYACERRFDVVSIRPTEQHLGVTILRPEAMTDEDRGVLGHSIHNLPPEVRWKYETNALILLAGSMGGLLAIGSGFADRVDDELALENVRELREGVGLEQLNDRERVVLAAAESPNHASVSDDDQVYNLAMLLLSEDDRQARAYTAWLRTVAASYVMWPTFRAGVDALVPVLLDRDVVSGDEAWDLIATATTRRASAKSTVRTPSGVCSRAQGSIG
jgi:hypothetical protein